MWCDLIDAQRHLVRAIAGRPRDECGPLPFAGAPWFIRGDAANAFNHWLLRSTCAFQKAPPFAIHSVSSNGERLSVDETIIESLPTGTLRKFTPNRMGPERAGKWPVMLCAPLAGHHAVMLRETVETLLEERDVFITDWADARDVPTDAGPLPLDDYVLAFERFMCTARGLGTPVHILAVCQATVPALAAAALLATEQAVPFASVSLLGGPLDTRLNPTFIDRFARSYPLDWFRDNFIHVVPPTYRGAGRRVYPGFVQHAAIITAHPERQLFLESTYWSNWLAGDLPAAMKALRSLNEYAAILDMAESYFLDIIRVVFHEHLLPRQLWSVAGRRVATEALCRTHLCTMEGDRDDIAGAGQTHCAHALCHVSPARPGRQLTVPHCNHYDLFTGSRWRDVVHPGLCSFWRDIEAVALDISRKRKEARHADSNHFAQDRS